MRSKKPSDSGTPAKRDNWSLLQDTPLINTPLIPPITRMDEKTLMFADAVWSGIPPYIAYRELYPRPQTKTQITKKVNIALWRKDVRLRIHQLDQIACNMDIKTAENRRNFVLDGLTSLASDESISPMARLKALELLGKVRGTDLFTDRVEQVTSNMTEEQVRQALAEKLAQLGVGAVTSTSDLAKEIKVIEHEPQGAPDTRGGKPKK